MKRVKAINALLKRLQGSSIYRLFVREYLKGWVLITLHESGRNIFSCRNFSPMTNASICLPKYHITLKIPFSWCLTSETLLLDVLKRNTFTGKTGVPLKVWISAPHFQVDVSRDRETKVNIVPNVRELDTPNRLLYWYSGTVIKWTRRRQLIADFFPCFFSKLFTSWK